MNRLPILVVLMLGLCIFTSTSPWPAQAHRVGQPQVVQVNGKDPTPYFDENVKLGASFPIADEIVREPALPTKALTFTVLRDRIPLEENIRKSLQFHFDFGDGTTAERKDKVVHAYTQPGSYIVTFSAINPKGERSPIETILVHVVPDLEYTLPETKIRLFGEESSTKSFDVIFGIPIEFSAKEFGENKNLTYTWSFDTETRKEGRALSHTFPKEKQYALVALQVKDENGLIGEDFAYISTGGVIGTNQTPVASATFAVQKFPASFPIAPVIVLGLILLASSIYLVYHKKS